jgi:hypothetical protein
MFIYGKHLNQKLHLNMNICLKLLDIGTRCNIPVVKIRLNKY